MLIVGAAILIASLRPADAAPVATRSSSSLGRASAAAGAFTITKPAGTTAGDVMVASIGYRPCSNSSGGGCTTSITAPAGWTLIRLVEQTTGGGTGGYGLRLGFWYRVSTAAEPASYTWTIGGTPSHNGAAGTISSFMNVDTANPIVTSAGQTTSSSRSHSTPDLGVLATNTMLVSAHAALSSATWTPPAGMTEIMDWASESVPSDLGMSLEINTEQRAAPGYTGVRTATFSNPPAADAGATHILALRPYQADPTIAMTLNSNLVVGSSSSYTLTIGNNGPMAISAANITVTNTLPTGLAYTSRTGTNWTCSAAGQVVTCTYGGAALPSGGTLPALTLNVNVVTGSVWTNTATVSSGVDGDNDLTNSTATYTWPANITTLATSSDPAATTIGPGAVTTDVNQFTLKTNTGTEPISSVTVNLSSGLGIDTLAITDNSNNVLGSVTSPAGGSVTIPVIGMTATTSTQTFKVRVKPLVHVSMPDPPGGSYAITAPVTSWSGPAAHAGSDTSANALTIDNLSPNSATATLANPGNQRFTLNWTTSNSSDFATTAGSVVYRWVGSTAGNEVPIEGSSPSKGEVNGTATVACVVNSNASTALTHTDGSGATSSCTNTALVSGQDYTYVVFQKDSRGNYDTGVLFAQPILTIGNAAVTEGDSGTKNMSFTVTRSVAIAAASTASYTLSNGSATGGATCSGTTDFRNAGGTVTIAAGSTTGTINVPICGDTNYEDDETFNVTLSNPSSNARLGTPSVATGTIINDDVDPDGCFQDNFDGVDDSAPSSNWATTTSSGTFGMPVIYDNRLRLTDASTEVSTAAHLQRKFPGKGNKIIVEFDLFAYGGNGADGIALTFSDAAVAPRAGAFGGSLGYAQKSNPGSDCTQSGGCPGFAGGWLGIGFDEFGNFSNETEGRIGGAGAQQPDRVAIRGSGSGQSGYRYHRSAAVPSGVDQPGATPGPNHRYRITIDHTDNEHAYVTVERSTNGGTSYSTIIPQYDAKVESGQATVPDNWLLSYTSSTGSSTNIHAIDTLKVCAVKPIISLVPVHHYELSLPTNGVACMASPITVTACADNTSPCTNKATTISGSTATLATSAGTLGSTTVTFDTSGTATTTLSYASASNDAIATVTLSDESMPATNSRHCCPNGADCTEANSCSITFNTAGFIFSKVKDGSVATIPNQVAGTQSSTYYLRAVKTNSTDKACTAALSDTTSVNLAFQCIDPATCSSGTGPNCGSGNGYFCLTPYDGATAQTAVPLAANPKTGVTSYSAVNLVFDSNGNAPFTFNYKDVGQVVLHAVKPASGTLLTNLVGATNPFVVQPYTLALSGIRCTTANADNCGAGAMAMTTPGDNPGAADAGGVTFIRAGDPFSVTVTARAEGGAETPNFGKEAVPEWVRLSPTLATIAGLTSNPSVDRSVTGNIAAGSNDLTVTSTAGYGAGDRIRVAGAGTAGADLITTISAVASATTLTLATAAATAVSGVAVHYMFSAFSGGSATGPNFTWGEVGIITLTPSVGDGSYLGSGSVTGTKSGNVGRFYPHHLGVAGDVVTRSDLQLTEPFSPTTGTINAGSKQLTVASVTGMAVGSVIHILGAGQAGADLVAKIGGIAGSVLTLNESAQTSVVNATVRSSGGFTYMGEPMKLTLTVTAYNKADGVTQNYTEGFAKLDAGTLGTDIAKWPNWTGTNGGQRMGLAAVSGGNLTNRLRLDTASLNSANPVNTTTAGGDTAGWSGGTSHFTLNVAFDRAAAPDGPFRTLKFGAKPRDADGVTLPPRLSSDVAHCVDLNVSNGNENAACDPGDAEADLRRKLFETDVRYGRLWLGNAYGSDQRGLVLPYEMQYAIRTNPVSVFVRNADDSLTPFADDNISLATGLTAPTTATLTPLVAGAGTINLGAPSGPGTVDVYVNLGSTSGNCLSHPAGTSAGRAYLSGRWCGAAFDRDPAARATFGIQTGRRGPIYIRESY